MRIFSENNKLFEIESKVLTVLINCDILSECVKEAEYPLSP